MNLSRLFLPNHKHVQCGNIQRKSESLILPLDSRCGASTTLVVKRGKYTA